MKFKRKKSTKQRASTFHGWGRGASHHKGAGNRGGRGRAGSGKKADGKKPSFWKEPEGKSGFTTKSRMKINAVNISQIQERINDLVELGIAAKSGNSYAVDLTKSRYNKLLATGTPKGVLLVKVDFASKGAVEKIKSAGGSVEVLKKIEKKQKKKPAHKKKADDDAAADAE